ncbi:unnamed protein product [Spirodela intermedia]|uniref:Uncharacterized protein n=2 Tax=Spirodela intermedia TaxID=51605 RepID=A0A7I8ICM9_SPIIN|nr:unnamed protein product [Spirodela intermedia]CAA6655409.1 unnamed protein product [Spirodela intermedia]CAA7390654.1 unnamed protein product [Spirodela intermedia]
MHTYEEKSRDPPLSGQEIILCKFTKWLRNQMIKNQGQKRR